MATYNDVQNQQAAQRGQEPFTVEKAIGMQEQQNMQQAQAQQFAADQARAEQANTRNQQDMVRGGAGQAAEIPAGMQYGGPGNVQQNPQPQGPAGLDQMPPEIQQQVMSIAEGLLSGQIGDQQLQQMPPELAQIAMGVAQEMKQSQEMAQGAGMGGLGVPPGYA